MRIKMKYKLCQSRHTYLAITILILIATNTKAQEFHSSSYHQYENPLARINTLENKNNDTNRSERDYFADQVSLIELYFKTEQYQKAEKIISPLEEKFKSHKLYQPKLALIKAHLLLHNHKTEDFLRTLEPHLTILQDTRQIELNTCYLYLLGAYQIRKHQFTKAFENLTLALEKSKTNKISHLELSIRNQLVQLHYYTKQYQRALELSDEIIDIALTQNDRFSEVSALTNKMNLYYIRAVHLSESIPDEEIRSNSNYQDLIKKSNQLQQQVFSLAEEIKAYRSMARALIIKQSQSFAQNGFQEAIEIGHQVIDLASQHHFEYESAVASNNMAIAYREMGMFKQSIESLQAAEIHYQQIENLQSLIWIYDDYAITYEMSNDYESALAYYKKFHKASMTFSNKTNNQSLLELQEKYATEEKTREISRLTQQAALSNQQLKVEKMGRWLLIVILAAVFIITLVLFQKRKNLKSLLQKEAALNQQITEINEAKQRFFNNLSHEFRTALTLSIGPLKRLVSLNDLSNKAYIESALENNLHMMTLLNEVLDIEKIDAKSLPMQLTKIDLPRAVDTCLNRFLLQFQEKQISVNKKGFDQGTTLFIDPSHFEKIIANILSNAGKYCFGQCTLDLKLSVEQHHIYLEICDNGPGISENELPYIFNRFYQGKSSLDKQLPGTGIGLSLVKELVELHHGKVQLFSQANSGCCIKLTFKRGQSHYPEHLISQENNHSKQTTTFDLAQSNYVKNIDQSSLNETISCAEKNDTHSKVFANKHRKIVLVVDDNAGIRQLIRGILQTDYHIVEADNGQRALQLAESIQPDLVIADVMMPLMDGFQLTQQMRDDEKFAHLSIILLTALSGAEQRVHGLLLGADDYIIKPFDNNELKARVRSHLIQKQRLSEILFKQYKDMLQQALPSHSFEGQETKRSKQLESIIAQNLSKWEFDIEQMYTQLNMTRSSLYRYTQKVYGCTPMNLLKKRRLELAYQMLKDYQGTISEVAYAVGYQSLSAFSRAFREYYEHPPTKVKKSQPNAKTMDAIASSFT